MNATLGNLYMELRRRAAGVDAILTTWLARESMTGKFRRLAARCAALERKRISVLEEWLAEHERGFRALREGDDDTLEEVAVRVDATLARLKRRRSFSRITLDEFEDDRPNLRLDQVVAGEALAPAFPVASGESIRLRHARRGDFGFRPHYLEVSLEVSDGQRNYSDYQIQFRLVGPGYERPIGESMLGSRFHDKDGGRVLVPFPRHKGNPVLVGTLEHLEVIIRNRGTSSTLVGASVGVGLGARTLSEQFA